jgi:hypothetical protein
VARVVRIWPDLTPIEYPDAGVDNSSIFIACSSGLILRLAADRGNRERRGAMWPSALSDRQTPRVASRAEANPWRTVRHTIRSEAR